MSDASTLSNGGKWELTLPPLDGVDASDTIDTDQKYLSDFHILLMTIFFYVPIKFLGSFTVRIKVGD